MPELRNVPLLMINEPSLPTREAMDEDKMQELVESMRDVGLRQPISIYKVGERFEIELGHRRYIAAQRLQWIEITSLVYDQRPDNSEAAMIDENLCREDNSVVEMAVFCAQLMEVKNLDTDGVAKRLKKSRDWVEQRLLLLQGDPGVFQALRERSINFSVARLLNAVEDAPMRAYFLDLAVRVGYKFRELDQMVRNWRSQGNLTVSTAAPVGDLPPQQPAPFVEEGCVLCGGNRDPYNMRYVKIHNHCADRIEAICREAAEAGK